jgi:hypothetical protein
LGRLRLPGVDIVLLRGNHEVFLERFLYDPACDFDFLEEWIDNGATSTFRELGFAIDALYRYPFDTLRAKAVERIGEAGLRCLGALRLARRIGSYVFVHAGVHPTKPFDLDDAGTLTWIRDPFLSAARWPHDFVVVHGHTPCGPEVKKHRIACDSGAFYTGVLTCAELQGDAVRFIAATPAVDVSALDRNFYRSRGRVENGFAFSSGRATGAGRRRLPRAFRLETSPPRSMVAKSDRGSYLNRRVDRSRARRHLRLDFGGRTR